MGLKEEHINLDEETAKWIITKYDKDNKGIRNLENIMKDILSKINFIVKNYKNISKFSCVSFKTAQKLKYPVNITISLINEIIKDDNFTTDKFKNPPFGMYL